MLRHDSTQYRKETTILGHDAEISFTRQPLSDDNCDNNNQLQPEKPQFYYMFIYACVEASVRKEGIISCGWLENTHATAFVICGWLGGAYHKNCLKLNNWFSVIWSIQNAIY